MGTRQNSCEDLRKILLAQNVLLDRILLGQGTLHEAVKNRDWLLVERTIAQIDGASEQFLAVDKDRDARSFSADMYKSDEVRGVLQTVRAKLIKSKIQSNAMGVYLRTVTSFLRGVIDSVLSPKETQIYGRNGRMVQRHAPSLVLNGLY